jgi:RNA polymerase sigma-70 factor (ECF subfamily)
MNPYIQLVTGPISNQEEGPRPAGGLDDVALFDRFLGGDDRAFVEIFDRHTPRLGSYCRKMVGDPQAVEDLLQDLWEKVYRFRENGKGTPPNPLGLLYWMTRNLCLNHLRSLRRHASIEDVPESVHPTSISRELTQMEEIVVIALERLPLQQREVLILNAYSGYTLEEIGQMLGESAGSIRTRAWRARTQLKRLIAALVELDENRFQEDERYHDSREEETP